MVEHLELLVDPRLELLPFPTDSVVARHTISEGAEPRIRLDLDRAYTTDVSVEASFLVRGLSGAGQLTPPGWKQSLPRNDQLG